MTAPGSPREFAEFYAGGDDEARVGFDSHTVPAVLEDAIEAKRDGGVRFCNKCLVFKPDRCHHCRQCGYCVLRMDHHCIWFSSCVGLRNHKYFLQFLAYVCLLCGVAALTAVLIIVSFVDNEGYLHEYIGLNFVFYAVLSTVFGIVLPLFTGYSFYNAVLNRTTLESMEAVPYRTSLPTKDWRFRQPPDINNLGNVYDVGIVPNLNQVLGDTWRDWILPVTSQLKYDGSYFPVNEELRAKAEERAQTEIAMHVRKQRLLEQQVPRSNLRMEFDR